MFVIHTVNLKRKLLISVKIKNWPSEKLIPHVDVSQIYKRKDSGRNKNRQRGDKMVGKITAVSIAQRPNGTVPR
jgi:hypothetical protein